MGEPALNPAVLEVLRALPRRYHAPGLLPSLSTVAPAGRNAFFDDLLAIKRELYPGDRFQLQFSVHSTDPDARRRLVPIRTWSLAEMARYGTRFHRRRERKVTLNFAACLGYPIDPAVLAAHKPSDPTVLAARKPSDPAVLAARKPNAPAVPVARKPSDPAAPVARKPNAPAVLAVPKSRVKASSRWPTRTKTAKSARKKPRND